MNKSLLLVVGFMIAIAGFYLFSRQTPTTMLVYDEKVTVYKSMSCGCCSAYASWLQRQVLDVDIVNMDDVIGIKEKYNIPANMRSCHTTVFVKYVVEGH
ncbi:hypothetical protein HY497_00345, partial [Candidatus Woesearchaeota archaeon]|nr:hypothetical protein [Candidatus Woesearchaeota archaeon]